ncbi:hypothetical protein ABZU76_01825 [Amycolatopsis sp. NPDC005232]|uniref:hypothetical protein n=1 Tax=Amycolatopsis sp. NPDC005232 TaxID=3157027 RepID=UPI0033BADEF5
MNRSLVGYLDLSRLHLAQLDLGCFAFVGTRSFSCFDSHCSFVDCCGSFSPGIFGGFGPRPSRLGVVCRLRFGRSGFGAAL